MQLYDNETEFKTNGNLLGDKKIILSCIITNGRKLVTKISPHQCIALKNKYVQYLIHSASNY